jgi:pyruvate/2-oxoglutarate dehydrogenase complex dihydrolipoamide acyltransferase (E2) component
MKMVDVLFPRLSRNNPDMEGAVAAWFVTPGDVVTAGQVLGEVIVEKVDAEIEAPAAGTVSLVVGEDVAVRQGEVIARIATA